MAYDLDKIDRHAKAIGPDAFYKIEKDNRGQDVVMFFNVTHQTTLVDFFDAERFAVEENGDAESS